RKLPEPKAPTPMLILRISFAQPQYCLVVVVPINAKFGSQKLLNHCGKLMFHKIGGLSAIARFSLIPSISILLKSHIKSVNSLLADLTLRTQPSLDNLMNCDQECIVLIPHIGYHDMPYMPMSSQPIPAGFVALFTVGDRAHVDMH